MAGRKPDYLVKVKHKETEETNPVGVAWDNPGGSITIRLNLCVVLPANPQLLITLFPVKPGERVKT